MLAEQDPEKRAQMMDAIDMRRGASLSRQSAQSKEEVGSFPVAANCAIASEAIGSVCGCLIASAYIVQP